MGFFFEVLSSNVLPALGSFSFLTLVLDLVIVIPVEIKTKYREQWSIFEFIKIK